MATTRWTPQQLARLHKLAGTVPPVDLARQVGHTLSSVRTRASREGLFIGSTPAPRFTVEEDTTLRALWLTQSTQQIADALERSPSSIRARAALLGLTRPGRRAPFQAAKARP